MAISNDKVRGFLETIGADAAQKAEFHADPTAYNDNLGAEYKLNAEELALVQDVDLCRAHFWDAVKASGFIYP